MHDYKKNSKLQWHNYNLNFNIYKITYCIQISQNICGYWKNNRGCGCHIHNRIAVTVAVVKITCGCMRLRLFDPSLLYTYIIHVPVNCCILAAYLIHIIWRNNNHCLWKHCSVCSVLTASKGSWPPKPQWSIYFCAPFSVSFIFFLSGASLIKLL